MRISTGLVALAFSVVTTAAFAGNVLLPSQGTTSPNYGLLPQTSTVEAAPAIPTLPTPTPVATPAKEQAPAAVTTPSVAAPSNTPDANGMSYSDDLSVRTQRLKQMGITVQQAVIPPEIQQMKDEINRRYKAMVPPSPPLITDDVSDQIAGQLDKNDPFVRASGIGNKSYVPTGQLTVAFVNSTFDSSDYVVIEDALGYSLKQAKSACSARVHISLLSTNDNSTFSVPLGQTKTAPFTAPAERVMVNVQAVCDPPRGQLPQNGGLIWRSNGKLIVDIASTDCQQPSRAASTMKIQYSGNNTVACVYTN